MDERLIADSRLCASRYGEAGCDGAPLIPRPESRHDRDSPLRQRAQTEEICRFDDDRILDRQRSYGPHSQL